MAYQLGRALTEISVIEDERSAGRVTHHLPGAWFRPDIEVDSRTRSLIEDRVMILLAGGEAEAAWCAYQADAPDGWRELVDRGAENDISGAIDMAYYVCGGSPPETEAYVEWLRQRVLSRTGRGPGFDASAYVANPEPFVVRRFQDGDERFWALVSALADAVLEAGALSWRRAKDAASG